MDAFFGFFGAFKRKMLYQRRDETGSGREGKELVSSEETNDEGLDA